MPKSDLLTSNPWSKLSKKKLKALSETSETSQTQEEDHRKIELIKKNPVLVMFNIPYDSTENDIREIIDKYTSGYSIYFMTNKEEYAPKSLDSIKGRAELPNVANNVLPEDENFKKPANNTLYVSNINFETPEKKLVEYFSKFNGFRKFTLLKSRKNSKSIGHGFATFATCEDAQDAVRKLASVTIDGHLLVIEYAKRQINTEEQEDEDVEGLSEFKTTKLLIKNLAFETNIKDLKVLFGSIVKVKNIRLPKKANGTPRGFAFVEFHSLSDLKKAVNKLFNVHLLGRRMIFLPSNHNDEE
uniref:Multiple RNA-binding domain-containing protein 1-like n=1 Tax=Dermatophagoides pteronyssinus TaxID=6956 RepID=A0A6P6YA78_DERPT|nr:multiple RNA-binding domain-containing protein 1-like [Dermatophagoides pteronyssinus]